ncbi:MAG: hypothetical protein R3258_02690 [Acidimicrobiia bacterium]|nr:hypothetical protein [Acidimicrobiia bacterium]
MAVLRRSRRWILLAVAAAALTLGVHLFAQAHDFGGTGGCGYEVGNSGWQALTNCTSKANNKWHAVYFGVVGNQWAGIDYATEYALDYLYDPTDLVAYRTWSDPYPDVIVYDHDVYGNNGAVAWVDCPANNTGIGGLGASRWCRGQILRYNAFYEPFWVDETWARAGLACHELGHTVGLREDTHETSGCMAAGAKDSPDGWYYDPWLHQHSKDHINANY